MISHHKKLIFIHIPKCAGTSIEKAFDHFSNYEGRGGQDHRTIRMIEKPLLQKELFSSSENLIEVLRGYKIGLSPSVNPKTKRTVTSNEFNEYFKFTIVRNPWSRVYSWYKNILRDEIHLRNYGADKDMSLNEFIKKYAGTSYPLRSQTYWLKNFKGKIDLDYIGRFEEIDETFNMLRKTLNMNDIIFPHEKRSENLDYRDAYDDESIDLVANIYKDDIDAFNYTFEK